MANFTVKVMHLVVTSLHLLHTKKDGFSTSTGMDTTTSLYQFLVDVLVPNIDPMIKFSIYEMMEDIIYERCFMKRVNMAAFARDSLQIPLSI